MQERFGSILLCGLVCGLKLEYISVSEVKVNRGLCTVLDGNGNFIRLEESVVGNLVTDIDQGTEQIDTWYFVYVIKNLDTQESKVLFSESVDAPVLPPGFSLFRRIGAIFNKWGGDIARFIQLGLNQTREYYWGEQRNTWCRLLDSGTADDWTEIQCGARASETAVAGYFLVTNEDGGGSSSMRVRFKGNIGTTGMNFTRKGWYVSATIAQGQPFRVPIVDEVIEYKVDNNQNSADVEILGFVEEL